MRHEVTIQDVPAHTVIAKRLEVATDGLGAAIQRTMTEIYAWVARAELEPAGEPFVVYHERPTAGTDWRIEICAPVSGPVRAPTGYVIEHMPATTVATTIHVGPYAELGAAYSEIEGFIRTHELDPAGPPREIYLSEPGVQPSQTRTRVEFPVSRLPMTVPTSVR